MKDSLIYRSCRLSPVLLAILLATVTCGLYAKHSDEFMLGTYSYIMNSFPFFYENRELLSRQMQQLGYNSTLLETDYKDPDLKGLLDMMDKSGLDVWITDRGWSNDSASPYRYALTPLSTSNYLRFEAEFSSQKAVKKGDGSDPHFWYAFRNDENIKRKGKAAKSAQASYGYVWKLTRGKDKPGYALSDLRYRWPNVNGDYIRFGKEFHLYQKNRPSYEDNYLWVTYRVKVKNLQPGLKPEDALFKLSLAGFELSGGGFAPEARLVSQKQGNETLSETVFTYKDYLTQKSSGDFFEVRIRASYPDLVAANLLTADLDNNPASAPSYFLLRINNLNPRLYWQGNCDLEVDYVEMEDQIHHELSSDPDFWKQGLLNRLVNLTAAGNGNVRGFYAFDEPYQGQFDSFHILENMISDAGYQMFSATYDYQYGKVVVDKKGPQYYNHLAGFRETVKPRILANDIYPVCPGIRFDPGKSKADKANFIQNVLDRKLIPVYQAGKDYCLQDEDRLFYPIVQAFGLWGKSGDKEQWQSWIRPPDATLKAMMFLPLCYGVDGIIHYRFQSYNTPEGYGDFAAVSALQDGKNYLPPKQTPETWNLLSQTNPKVKLYGTMIRNLSWKGSQTVMLKELKDKALKQNAMLSSVKVKRAKNGSYEGYVQLGVYQDADGNPYLMAVNRRGNYFKAGKYSDARYVPPTQYAECFPEAEAQTILFSPDEQARKRFGGNPALLDPVNNTVYFGSNGVIELSLPAGEGKLLQMIGESQAKAIRALETQPQK